MQRKHFDWCLEVVSSHAEVSCRFPAERAIIFRERASKSYQVSSYFLAKLVAEQPLRILSTLVRLSRCAHVTCILYKTTALVVHNVVGDQLSCVCRSSHQSSTGW